MNYEDLLIEYASGCANELCKLADQFGKDRDETIGHFSDLFRALSELATFEDYEITEEN